MQSHTRELVRRGAALILVLALCVNSSASLALADTSAPTDQSTATSTDPGVVTTDQTQATSTDQSLATSTDTAPAADPNLNASSTGAVATSTQGTGGQQGSAIDTGNATASTTVDNQLNTTSASPDAPGKTNSSSITASTTDEGTTTASTTADASTGDNVATSSEGLSTIVTGIAQATANVINEVNTNIFNSDGLILFLNQLFGGGFDLNFWDLSYFFVGGPGASPSVQTGTTTPQCTLLTCLNSSSLNVLNTNDATVTNDVIVRSSTGGNQASSTGDASIGTGDAYAAANVVNLVNTNIVNSSYLLLSFNNFGDLAQNITLPGSNFFGKLFANGEASSSINASTINIGATSTALFMGTTTASATTGDNIATSSLATSTLDVPDTANGAGTTTESATTTPSTTGSGAITTGNAYSSATTLNQLNHTGVGGTSVFLLFRVAGSWTGHVVGLPLGLLAQTIPDGTSNLIEIESQDATTSPEAAQLLAKFNSSQYNVLSTSTANVANNVDVGADTGHNQATSSNGLANITTGNAYAAANVVNLVNTDIIGQNWIFGVFNLFGNFSGDIVFSDGAPQLNLSASVAPQSTSPGGTVTYTFVVTNPGDADATNVTLNATFDNTLLSFDPGSGASTTITGASWNLSVIPRGSSRTFTYTANVGRNFPSGQTATVPLTIAAVNNDITAPVTSATVHDDITVTAPASSGGSGNGGGGGGGGGGPVGLYGSGGGAGIPATASPQIKVTKVADVSTTTAPAIVNYKVSVSDPDSAGPLYSAVLEDTLYAPDGSVMYDKSWSLDTVNPGDLINLSYGVQFGASTTPGTYKNVAKVSGMANHPYAGSATSTQAVSYLTFTSGGQVLGESTSTPDEPTGVNACALTLNAFLVRGRHNPTSEVIKLQAFLNIQGFPLPITGYFGPMTASAVSSFQTKFAQDVLEPLGLTSPTGAVFALTERKINELTCSQ